MNLRPVRQREPRIELPKLRKSAQHAPMCFACWRPNQCGNLVLAHDNWLEAGKGVGYKSHDIFGAIVCGECHDQIDGRAGHLPEDERRAMHNLAHRATLVWWVQEGYLKC